MSEVKVILALGMRNLSFTITVKQAFNRLYQHMVKSYKVVAWLKNANQEEVPVHIWKLKDRFQQY